VLIDTAVIMAQFPLMITFPCWWANSKHCCRVNVYSTEQYFICDNKSGC